MHVLCEGRGAGCASECMMNGSVTSVCCFNIR